MKASMTKVDPTEWMIKYFQYKFSVNMKIMEVYIVEIKTWVRSKINKFKT